MRLATIRTIPATITATATRTAAVRIDENIAVELGAFLARPDWRAAAVGADGPRHNLTGLDYATLIPRPEKVFCGVGHAHKPPRYLTEGARLATRVEGLGEQRNILVAAGTGR